jgi:hypothetical protein
VPVCFRGARNKWATRVSKYSEFDKHLTCHQPHLSRTAVEARFSGLSTRSIEQIQMQVKKRARSVPAPWCAHRTRTKIWRLMKCLNNWLSPLP